jgi:hypothetical protein
MDAAALLYSKFDVSIPCAHCGCTEVVIKNIHQNPSSVVVMFECVSCGDCDDFQTDTMDELIGMVKPKTSECDCGGKKCKTTCATWCSSRKEQ